MTKTENYFKKIIYQKKFISRFSVLIIDFNLQVLPSFGSMMRVEGGVHHACKLNADYNKSNEYEPTCS